MREWLTDRNKRIGIDRENVAEVADEGPGRVFVVTKTGGKYWLKAEFAEFFGWWKSGEVKA